MYLSYSIPPPLLKNERWKAFEKRQKKKRSLNEEFIYFIIRVDG